MLKRIRMSSNDDRNVWEFWKPHREVISSLITEKIAKNHNNTKSVAIFGAGKCNDLDLHVITDTFEEVVLFDINTGHMEEGINKQNLNAQQREKIKLVGNLDFTGMDVNLSNELVNQFAQNASIKRIIRTVRLIAGELDIINLCSEYQGYFSAVISSTVHSQLFSSLVEKIYKYLPNYSQKEIVELHNELKYLYQRGTPKYNDLLLSVANSNASFLFVFDLIEISKDNNTLQILPIIEKSIIESKPTLVAPILQNHGVMGSIDGFSDIGKRLNDILKEKYIEKKQMAHNLWIWKFTNTKSYYINSIVTQKNCFKG